MQNGSEDLYCARSRETKSINSKQSGCSRVIMATTEMKHNEEISAPSFRRLFHWNLSVLRFMGISSMSGIFSDHQMEGKWWEGGPMLIGFVTIGTVIIFEIKTVAQIGPDQFSYMIIISSSIAPNLACLIKFGRLWTSRARLYNLLQRLRVIWESSTSGDAFTQKMAHAAESNKSLSVYYSLGIYFMCSLYIVYPYSSTLFDYFLGVDNFKLTANVFPFDIPYKINSFFLYIFTVTFQQLGAAAVCVIWASCDTLFAQLTFHVTLHFMVLTNELQVAIDKSRDSDDHHVIEIALKDIIERYQQLFECCKSIKTFFDPIIFFTIISNGVSLCFCAFRLNDNVINGHWADIPKVALALMCTSAQTMIYCVFAEKMTESSEAMNHTVYNSHWTYCNKKLKKTLFMLMTRAQKEFKYTVYGLFDINYMQLTQIFNAAISYFMLLRNTS